jgi:anti-sigma28 factor (negative regulator of flagellin synthesis)
MIKKIKLELFPTRYGNGNATETFEKKEVAFELELSDSQSTQRNIISLEQVEELKKQIEDAMDSYSKFMNMG